MRLILAAVNGNFTTDIDKAVIHTAKIAFQGGAISEMPSKAKADGAEIFVSDAEGFLRVCA